MTRVSIPIRPRATAAASPPIPAPINYRAHESSLTRPFDPGSPWERFFSDARLIRRGDSPHYKESGAPCTNGQVFHSRYRENLAKTRAKVEFSVTYLFCDVYRILA